MCGWKNVSIMMLVPTHHEQLSKFVATLDAGFRLYYSQLRKFVF